MSTNKPSKQTKKPEVKPEEPATPSHQTSAEARVEAARKAAFHSDNQAEAFAYFVPLAEQIAPEALPPSPGKYGLLRTNLAEALDLLVPHLPRVAARMVDPPLREVFELPALALALTFAAARVPVRAYSEGEIAAARAELGPLREVTLNYLEVAAHPTVKLVPETRVRAVRAGKGPIDTAQDGVTIAGLFAEYADVLEGKHPFTPAQLSRLEEIGGMLVQTLRPSGAVAPASASPHDSARLRDQLEALLAARYEQLRLCAAVAFGASNAQQRIPALRRAAPPSRAPADATPPVVDKPPVA